MFYKVFTAYMYSEAHCYDFVLLALKDCMLYHHL